MTTIAILSALLDEQRGLLGELSNPNRVRRGGRDFWCGQWHGRDVVLALSKIGKVAAATTATTLIESFGAKSIVFTGVAGGVGVGVNVGDVVVASDFVQHDMDASPLFSRYEVPLYGRSRFPCDAALTAILLEAANEGLTWACGHFEDERSGHRRKVHQGLIASGDRFVSDLADAAGLVDALQQFGLNPLAVEMEGAAVAQVCHDYALPFAAVRTVSDRADSQAHVDFSEFVNQVASPYALVMIRHLMKRL